MKTAGLRFLLLAVAVLCLCVCSCTQKQDQLKGKLGYEELYKNAKLENQRLRELREREHEMEVAKAPTLPPLEPLAPRYNPLDEVRISISMQQETLHDILFVVARNAGLNLVIEPGVSLNNRVTISFENAKSSIVINTLLRAYDLAWEVADNVLYVKCFVDKTFDLGFLNSKTTMEIKSGGNIFGTVDVQDGNLGDMQGSVRIEGVMGKAREEDSLYEQLYQNVTSIINEYPQPAQNQIYSESFRTGGQSGAKHNKSKNTEADEAHSEYSGSVSSRRRVETGQGVPSDVIDKRNGTYVLDSVAGTLFVKSTPAKVKAVERLIDNLKSKLTRQVVIDARILEVTLSDSFSFGIDWNYVANELVNDSILGLNIGWNGQSSSPVISIPDNFISSSSDAPSVISQNGTTVSQGTHLLDATIEALETFGGIKVISSPHVRTKHGQPTLLTSGRMVKYVDSVERNLDNTSSGVDSISYTVETAKIFDGIMLGVLPFINADGSVDMQIFPIKSQVDESSLSLVEVADGVYISLPEVDIKNISTSVRVRNGETVILGGLIDKEHDKTDGRVPGLGQVPLLGWLFQQRERGELVRELVIIMHVQVLGG